MEDILLKKIEETKVRVVRDRKLVEGCEKISDVTPKLRREFWEEPLDSCDTHIKRSKKIAQIRQGNTLLFQVGIRGCPDDVKITIFNCQIK